jgi:hypothetical protein
MSAQRQRPIDFATEGLLLADRVGGNCGIRLKAALIFVLFHKRVCGPLAHSLFNRKLDFTCSPKSKLETAYRKADDSIQKIVDLLAA